MKHATQQALNIQENDPVLRALTRATDPYTAALAALISDYYAGRVGAGMLAMNAYMLGRRHVLAAKKEENHEH